MAGFALLMFAANAAAADPQVEEPAWYVEVNAGYVLPQQGKGTDRDPGNGTQANPPSQTEFAFDYGKGLFGGVVAGRRADDARFELELQYLENGIDEPGATQLGADRQGGLAALANAWFEFGASWVVQPYVGGGAGVIRKSISGASDDAFAGQVGWGAGWEMSPGWTLTAGYRYLDTGPMKFDRGGHEFTSSFRSQIVSLGLRYLFATGPTSSADPAVVVPVEPAPAAAPEPAPDAEAPGAPLPPADPNVPAPG